MRTGNVKQKFQDFSVVAGWWMPGSGPEVRSRTSALHKVVSKTEEEEYIDKMSDRRPCDL